MRSDLSPTLTVSETPAKDSFSSCSEGDQGTLVCHCFQVRLQELQVAIEQGGAQTLEDLSLLTRAGNGCRGCESRLTRVLSGLSPSYGRFGLCGKCDCVEALCTCADG